MGLPRGEAGNTETGHINLGAGKIVYQDLARINMSIADGAFFENEVLNSAIEHALKNNSSIHLMGLLGAGGVHSNMEHLFSLLHLCALREFKKVYIHVFTDGRDSPPSASLTYLDSLKSVMDREGIGQVASIMGRYWAMDRDRRWERTQKAYVALTRGVGKKFKNPEDAIRASYEQGITDEFIEPSIITGNDKKSVGLVNDNDAVVFFNFRIDRPRQLTYAFIKDNLKDANRDWGFDPYAVEYEHKHYPEKVTMPVFERGKKIENLYFVTMTEYSKPIVEAGAHVAFPPEHVRMPLGRVLSLNNMRQLRAAESEKERFVTYYFNGQNEKADYGEDRVIVPSPSVPTYDLKPEMSAYELTAEVYRRLVNNSGYAFVLINYANVDMVGHTGNLSAAVKAVETVDHCIGELGRFVMSFGGTLIITADHGNAEEMVNSDTGEINTEHSVNPVPFVAVSKEFVGKGQMLPAGILADVAPTVLNLLGIQSATSMTGRNLLASIARVKKR